MSVPNCQCSDNPFQYMLSMPARVRVGDPPAVMDFLQCDACGLMRLDERHCLPDSAYEDETYRDTIRKTIDEDWHNRQSAQGKMMAEGLQLPPGDSVVDIGAGFGHVLNALQSVEAPRRVLAIEPNEAARGVLETNGVPVVETISKATELFDHVLCILVLEHVSDPWALLREAQRLMYTDSVLHVVIPSLDVQRAWQETRYRQMWFCAQHRWYMTPDALGAVLGASGFKADKWEGWTRPDGWRYTYMRGVPKANGT